MQLEHRDILHLLKSGRSEEVQAMVKQEQRKNYSGEFVPFMDEMLKEYKVSRKKVAIRSGLSQDYVYKLLRGDKHTNERDYILAMCFAIGMSLAQTQHALSSYGMPTLSEGDMRSQIILLAIRNGDGIDELDEMLEKAGFPLLKTSPEMPSAPIVDTSVPIADAGTSIGDTGTPAADTGGAIPAQGKKVSSPRSFEEVDSFTEGYYNGGGAPFDYDYQGWIKLEDEEGHLYQVEAVFAQTYTSLLVFTEEQRKEAERLMELRQKREAAFYEEHKAVLERTGGRMDSFTQPELYEEFLALQRGIPAAEMLERYESLEEAAGSEFFPYFLELDKRTDQKVQEVMRKVDDTREWGPGIRMGACVRGGRRQMYMESFNTLQPELREYCQIVEDSDGTIRYTATHESCFMQIELGKELHELYFGYKREPEFFIDVKGDDYLTLEPRYRFLFQAMKLTLHENALRNGAMFPLDPVKVKEERVEFLVQQGIMAVQAGDDKKAVGFYQEAIRIMEEMGAPEKGYLTAYICTCKRIACCFSACCLSACCVSDGCLSGSGITNEAAASEASADEWWAKIYALKDAVTAGRELGENDFQSAVSCVAEAAMHFYRRYAMQGNRTLAADYVDTAVELIQSHDACREDWILLFEAYGAHAFQREEENLEESLAEYRKALTLARNHHLDQIEQSARSVATLYNNYAWVLWNRCGSEEAVLHYGRAIDLLESYLFSGIVEKALVLRDLDHVGRALNQIYTDLGKQKESEGLRSRLAEDGVKLE